MQNSILKRDEILETIIDLISFKTVEGAFDVFEKTVQYCENFFLDTNVVLKKYNYAKHPALIVLSKETNSPTFLLQGHLDVVHGSDSQFKAQCKGDYIYGRGTVDMKGFDALAMHLIKEISSINADFSVGLMLTFDEEIGSINGAAKLADENILPEILINGDGGYNHAVIHAEKGILKIKLQVESGSGRHPYPWDGQNAFDLLLEDYYRITSLFQKHADASDADNWYTTYSSYDVKVENEPSFAPHFAEMKVNIYFTEDIACEKLFEQIEGQMVHSKVEEFMCTERVFLERDNGHIKNLQRIMQQHFEVPIVIRSENGSSDARFFTNKGIPIVIVKMVGEDHHGPNERLHIPSIMPMYSSLMDYMKMHVTKSSNEKYKSSYDQLETEDYDSIRVKK